jgi:hypothetical protein
MTGKGSRRPLPTSPAGSTSTPSSKAPATASASPPSSSKLAPTAASGPSLRRLRLRRPLPPGQRRPADRPPVLAAPSSRAPNPHRARRLAAVWDVESWEARSGFQLSTPQRVVGLQPGCWGGWSIAERRVWPDGVVGNAPSFREHLHLLERVEDLSV